MASKSKRTDAGRAAFLAELTEGASVSAACTTAGLSRSMAYAWRREDEDFAAAWDDAVEAGTDALEDVAVKRAKDSSDTLLIFMLKARRPDRYKERPVRLKLPVIKTADDVLQAAARTIEAMASGEITPSEAATVSGVLEQKRRAIETVDIEQRLAALEQQEGSKA